MFVMSFFSDSLKAAIESSGLSQGKIADEIGVLRSNFNAFVNGKRPLTEDKLEKLLAISQLKLSKKQIEAWQAMDEYSPEALIEAARLLGIE
jgi:transcriptional regulator with XRE-family HTH domain